MSDSNIDKENFRPDWGGTCENCEENPTVPSSALCGPCHFGTADAIGGDWWDDKTDWFRKDFEFFYPEPKENK